MSIEAKMFLTSVLLFGLTQVLAILSQNNDPWETYWYDKINGYIFYASLVVMPISGLLWIWGL